MRSVNKVVLEADDDTDQDGMQIDSNQLISASFQPIFSDIDADGSVKVQMSNEEYPTRYLSEDFTVTDWSDIPLATSTVTAGVASPIIIPQVCARWLRVVFTQTTPGTGTIKVNFYGLSV